MIIKKLIKRSEVIQQQTEIEISKLKSIKQKQDEMKLVFELNRITLQRELFNTNDEICNKFKKDKLYELLRKRSVVTHKINQINIQITSIVNDIKQTESRLKQQLKKKNYWYKKEKKYELWIKREHREAVKKEMMIEEKEQEEIENVKQYNKSMWR